MPWKRNNIDMKRGQQKDQCGWNIWKRGREKTRKWRNCWKQDHVDHTGDFELSYAGKFLQGLKPERSTKCDRNVFSTDHSCCCMDSELQRRESGSTETIRRLWQWPRWKLVVTWTRLVAVGGGEGRSCSECVLETESTELVDGFNVEC